MHFIGKVLFKILVLSVSHLSDINLISILSDINCHGIGSDHGQKRSQAQHLTLGT